MLTVHGSTFARSVVVPLTFFAFLSGCHKWSTVDTSPGQYLSEDQPDKVRVTWRGYPNEIWSPVIQADSIIGQGKDGSRIAIPIDEIEKVETRKSDPGGIVALTLGILVGVAAIGAIICLSGGCTMQPMFGGS
jgi:hypothetical protein